jgi:signal transduction histidine kinase
LISGEIPQHVVVAMAASASPNPPPPAILPEVRIAALYVILGSVWIIGSDRLVDHFSDATPHSIMMQSVKGLNFVATTGILLFFILRRSFGGWRKAEQLRIDELTRSGQRFRELSQRLQALRENERSTIAREIHDELGQQLTGIKIKLRLLENQLERSGDRALNPLIDLSIETQALIDDAIASVRRVSSGLRPQALDHLGLAAAIIEEARAFTQRTGIPCDLAVEPIETALPSEIETAAFRIFQESLTNVARHSQASRVEAACQLKDGHLELIVRDNGTGMDPALAEKPVTLGLLGMWERARHLGGKVVFQSAANQGTKVILDLPVSPTTTAAQVA